MEENLRGELTYLVNAIRKPTIHGHNDASMIPYSMVTGVDPEEKGVLGKEWKRDEIAVNQWASKDLNLSLGDSISLEYFIVGERRHLIEKNRTFRVAKILPSPDPVLPSQRVIGHLISQAYWMPKIAGNGIRAFRSNIRFEGRMRITGTNTEERQSVHFFGYGSRNVGQSLGKVTGLRIEGEDKVEFSSNLFYKS